MREGDFMGLTCGACGLNALRRNGSFQLVPPGLPVVALAGNPNTGKSTLFNRLTGLNQHTGNWPGKTVLVALGRFSHRGRPYTLVDLPGTYSLTSSSAEERAASDFLCFDHPEVTVVVTDAGCLERNLNLVFQVRELTPRMVVAVNLVDEAGRRGIMVDTAALGRELGVPAVATVAHSGKGVPELLDIIEDLALGRLRPDPVRVTFSRPVEDALAQLMPRLESLLPPDIDRRWFALRLLQGDDSSLVGFGNRLQHGRGVGGGPAEPYPGNLLA